MGTCYELRGTETACGLGGRTATQNLKGVDCPRCLAALETERKFLVSSFLPECDWPVPYTESIIEQTFLVGKPSTAERVRRRFYLEEHRTTFTHTIKTHVTEGTAVEEEREVEAPEYMRLLNRSRLDSTPIHKVRKVFEWEGRTFELDVFNAPAGVVMLEVELPNLEVVVEMPPFIVVEREVTGEREWSNSALARSGAPPAE